MDGCQQMEEEEEPVAHSTPKSEQQQRRSRLHQTAQLRLGSAQGTLPKQLQETAVQLFPWIPLSCENMSDVHENQDHGTSSSTPQPQHPQPLTDSSVQAAYAPQVRQDGHTTTHQMEIPLSASLSLAQRMVSEEDIRPPSLPFPAAAASDSVTTASSAGSQGCDSAPSTPVSPDTTSLKPSASFDSQESWAGQAQPLLKTHHSNAAETPSTDGRTASTDSTNKPRPKKRSRMQYSENQVSILENAFRRNRYPTRQERDLLHQTVGLPPEKVKTWFQNRRSREKRNLASRLQQQQHQLRQQQQQQQQQHIIQQQQQQQQQQQHQQSMMQHYQHRPSQAKSGAEGVTCTSPVGVSPGGLPATALQHHSHSAILTAYPGGMLRVVPGQYPMPSAPVQPPHGQVSLIRQPERLARSVRGDTLMPEAVGMQSERSAKPETVVSPGPPEQPMTGHYDSAPRMWNRVSPTGIGNNVVAEHIPQPPSVSPPMQRGTGPAVSPPLVQQAFHPATPNVNPGLFRQTAVSPTSIYNPGITYPFPYGSSGGCYPFWMNYPATVPVGVAFAGGSPQDMAQGIPRQWPNSTSPPDGTCMSNNPSPWAGQILAGCTADWVRNPIMQYPQVAPQPVPAAGPCATTSAFNVAPVQEYPRREFRGLVSPSSCVPVNIDVLAPSRSGTPLPEQCSPVESPSQTDKGPSSADSTTGMAGRSAAAVAAAEHFVPVDFATMGRFSPITREYNLSPYLCYPSSRDCTPTKSMTGEGEKTSWMSPLNTPEMRSLTASQSSSRVASPAPEGEDSPARTRQPNEAASKVSELHSDELPVVKGEKKEEYDISDEAM